MTLEKILKLIKENLPSDWDLYESPFLNGIQPDLVLFSPTQGINLFFVEWLEAENFSLQNTNGRQNDFQIITQNANETKTHNVPLWRLRSALVETEKTYGFRLRQRISMGYIPALNVCLIYPRITFTSGQKRKLVAAVKTFEHSSTQAFILDHEDCIIEDKKLFVSKLMPQNNNLDHPIFEQDAVADFRNWLQPSGNISTPVVRYSANQKRLIENRDSQLRRRVRGGPGSGKTEALIARACELQAEGKEILYLTYNLTLLEELRQRTLSKSKTNSLTNITILNFHDWCGRIAYQYGFEEEYKRHFGDSGDAAVNQTSFETVGHLVLENVRPNLVDDKWCFDAVIIDEFQDMSTKWIKSAALVLRPHGELLIAADVGQDIYERAINWDVNEMEGLGFRGRWMDLSTSERTPGYFVDFLNRFKQNFIHSHNDHESLDLEPFGRSEIEPSLAEKISWTETFEERLLEDTLALIHKIVADDEAACAGRAEVAIEDLVVLVPAKKIGAQIARNITALGIQVSTTFLINGQNRVITERDLKLMFSSSSAKVKISTIHSFKGLGSTRILLVLNKNNKPAFKNLVYVGLSRVQQGPFGQSLYVVSSNSMVNGFYQDLNH
jgi:hypothetical protein